MLSVASLQSLDSRLVFPEPVSPIHTRSYSGLGGGCPLQHSVLKHWRQEGEGDGERERERKEVIESGGEEGRREGTQSQRTVVRGVMGQR